MKASILTVLCVMAVAVPLTALPQETPKAEDFSALVYLPSGAGPRMVGAGATANVNIHIGSYTPDATAQKLAQTLLSKGQTGLRKDLEDMDVIGRVSLTGRVGQFQLKLIRVRPLPGGGRRIIGVSDRPIEFLEMYAGGRSTQYDIGIIQIDLKPPDNKGKEEGEGALIYAAAVKVIEANKVEVESYGVQPARLMSVRKF